MGKHNMHETFIYVNRAFNGQDGAVLRIVAARPLGVDYVIDSGPSLPIRPPKRGAETANAELSVRMLDIEISVTRRRLALLQELRADILSTLPDDTGHSA